MLTLTMAVPNFSPVTCLLSIVSHLFPSITRPVASDHLGAFNKYQYLGSTPAKLNQNVPMSYTKSIIFWSQTKQDTSAGARKEEWDRKYTF